MNDINGFKFDVLDQQIFSRLPSFTADSITDSINRMKHRVDQHKGPVFLAFGENCGPGVKLREAGLASLGSGYFDNLVVTIEDIPKILDSKLLEMLQIRHLVIGRWEGHDSVYNREYRTFFHHYFHPHDMCNEKSDHSDGIRRRLIEQSDVPLFLAEVLAQFEYLREKLAYILASNHEKFLIIRRVDGSPIENEVLSSLNEAIIRFGAKNFALRVVHSLPINQEKHDTSRHRFIPESCERRWGDANAWLSLV